MIAGPLSIQDYAGLIVVRLPLTEVREATRGIKKTIGSVLGARDRHEGALLTPVEEIVKRVVVRSRRRILNEKISIRPLRRPNGAYGISAGPKGVLDKIQHAAKVMAVVVRASGVGSRAGNIA